MGIHSVRYMCKEIHLDLILTLELHYEFNNSKFFHIVNQRR